MRIQFYINKIASTSIGIGLIAWLAIGQLCHAATPPHSSNNFYQLAVSILSYSKWSDTTNPSICVIDSPDVATQLQSYIHQQSYHYQVQPVDAKALAKTKCHVAYFSITPPLQQQQLIRSYSTNALLSISTNDPNCEIGSIFCLYQNKNSSSFKVNLDSLSYAKVHIDPRVLLLAKNME